MKNKFAMGVLTMLSAATLSMQALAAPVLQSSAILTDVGFRVTDLTPGDGNTPLAAILPSQEGGDQTMVYGQGLLSGEPQFDNTQYVNGSFFEATAGNATGFGTDASKEGNGASTFSYLDEAEALSVLGSVKPGLQTTDYTVREAGVITAGSINVFIGAQTSVTFFGRASLNTMADAAVLSDAEALQQLLLGGLSVDLDAGAKVTLAYVDVNDPTGAPFQSVVFRNSVSSFSQLTGLTNLMDVFGNDTIELTITNDTDQDIVRELMVSVTAYSALSVNPPPVIPEPGTLALMGLGLVGLAWVRRHKAEAKAQPA